MRKGVRLLNREENIFSLREFVVHSRLLQKVKKEYVVCGRGVEDVEGKKGKWLQEATYTVL